MGKFSKAYHYLVDRFWELKICVKEFKSESKLDKDAYQAHFKSRLLVDVHSVEKGIGLSNAKPGHSGKVVITLIDKLNQYMNLGFDIRDFAFKETFCVISAYIDFQKQYDTASFSLFPAIIKRYDRLCGRLGQEYVEAVRKELMAGAREYTKEELEEGKDFDFSAFIDSRHSIRSFDGRAIDADTIKEIVAIANKAPSACNRQPSHVYFTNAENTVGKIDALITGSNGFKGETPNYMLLTVDRAAFAKEEQFQWYINGGIYLSYLTLAMHSKGIGNCIMQWKAFYKTEKELKALMGISKQEAIIAVVACGYYKDSVRCIHAQRRNGEDTVKIVG